MVKLVEHKNKKKEQIMNKKLTNCVFVGLNAGEDILEGDRIVIIGDNIRNLDHKQKNVVFLGDKVAIGEKLFGVPINVAKVIREMAKWHSPLN